MISTEECTISESDGEEDWEINRNRNTHRYEFRLEPQQQQQLQHEKAMVSIMKGSRKRRKNKTINTTRRTDNALVHMVNQIDKAVKRAEAKTGNKIDIARIIKDQFEPHEADTAPQTQAIPRSGLSRWR